MQVSVKECKPDSIKWIPNVYTEIKKYEKDKKVKIHYYEALSLKEKEEVIDKIVIYIQKKDLLKIDSETSRFIKEHHKEAWNKAVSSN